jgi:spore coat protein CotH
LVGLHGAVPRCLRSIAALLALASVATACGGTGSGAAPDGDVALDVALFDSGVVHEIAVEFDQEDYDDLIDAFVETGEKSWMEATVTIDGTTFEQVGMRLKGNSSLAGLGGGRGPGGFGGMGGASADDPASLPWLIRLDEFVEGQEHQGYEDIVIRSNGSATSLNEAVALDLLAEAGLASQQAAAAGFSVNGGEAVLRLAIEHPDDDAWQDRAFDGAGALYKAESTGDWSYRGDDPSDYGEAFDQEGGSDLTDLSPVIELLRFLDESTDDEFAAELPERLDVDAFATYLAAMDLVANFDDIDGPGNNAYLWYDVESGRFTVVPWDLNLAFGAMGGFGGPGGGPPGGGGVPPEGFDPDDLDPEELPEGFDPGELPEGFDPEGLPEGFDPGQLPGGAGQGPGGGFGRGNVLVERFHADAGFEALYEAALVVLREQLYGSGLADEALEARVDALLSEAADLVDEATVRDEASAIAEQFTAG